MIVLNYDKLHKMIKLLFYGTFVTFFCFFISIPTKAGYFGTVDDVDNYLSKATGWFCDNDTAASTPTIKIYATNYSSSECKPIAGNNVCLVDTTQANLSSETSVKEICKGYNRRFKFDLYPKLADGKMHKLFFQAVINGRDYNIDFYESSEDNEYFHPANYRYKNIVISSNNPNSVFTQNYFAPSSPNYISEYCSGTNQLNQINGGHIFFNNSYNSSESQYNVVDALPLWCSGWQRLSSWSLKNYLNLSGSIVSEYGVNAYPNTHAAGVYKQGEQYYYATNLQPYYMLCPNGDNCQKTEGFFILAPSTWVTNIEKTKVWKKDPNAVIEASIDVKHPLGQIGEPRKKKETNPDGSTDTTYIYDGIGGYLTFLFQDTSKPVTDSSSRIWISVNTLDLNVSAQQKMRDQERFAVDGAFTRNLIVAIVAGFESAPYFSLPSGTNSYSSAVFPEWRKYVVTISPQQFLKILDDAEAQESQISNGDGGRGVDFNYNRNLSDWSVAGINYGVEMYTKNKSPSKDSYLSTVFKDLSLSYYSNSLNLGWDTDPTGDFSSPLGAVGGIDPVRNKMNGWTCDLDLATKPNQVHLYYKLKNSTNAFQFLTSGVADKDYGQAVANICGDKNHGFDVPLTSKVTDGREYEIRVFAINYDKAGNMLSNNVLLSTHNYKYTPPDLDCDDNTSSFDYRDLTKALNFYFNGGSPSNRCDTVLPTGVDYRDLLKLLDFYFSRN